MIYRKLRHPNILLFIGACTKPGNMCFVTEYLEGGNLYELLHEKGKKFELKEVIYLSKQAAFGLNYLHLSNIIHRFFFLNKHFLIFFFFIN